MVLRLINQATDQKRLVIALVLVVVPFIYIPNIIFTRSSAGEGLEEIVQYVLVIISSYISMIVFMYINKDNMLASLLMDSNLFEHGKY